MLFRSSFAGIVIAVSHDRYFLDNLADRIFEFDREGNLTQYEGGYTDYLEAKKRKGLFEEAPATKSSASKNVSADSAEEKESVKTWKQNRPSKLKFSYKEQKEFETIDDDIAKLEAQGCDVSGLRNRPPVPEDDDEEEEAFDNPTRLDRLKPYLQTPRDMETPFFRAVAGNAPWLFKDRWKKKYTESPVIYAAVVQANSALWRPGDNDYYPAVFVFALDKKHIHDVEWLSQMAEKISELSDSPTVPDDCRKLINTLRDSQSEFCFRIGKSVSGDADAWCATYKFDKQSALPRKALPSDGIVPFLLKANPVENQFVDFKLIPSELYIG